MSLLAYLLHGAESFLRS